MLSGAFSLLDRGRWIRKVSAFSCVRLAGFRGGPWVWAVSPRDAGASRDPPGWMFGSIRGRFGVVVLQGGRDVGREIPEARLTCCRRCRGGTLSAGRRLGPGVWRFGSVWPSRAGTRPFSWSAGR